MMDAKYNGQIFNWLPGILNKSQHDVMLRIKQSGISCCDFTYRKWRDTDMVITKIPAVCNELHFSHVFLFDHGSAHWNYNDFMLVNSDEWHDISMYYPAILGKYETHEGYNLVVKKWHLLSQRHYMALVDSDVKNLHDFGSNLLCTVMRRLDSNPLSVFRDDNLPRRLNPVSGLNEIYIPGLDIMKFAREHPDDYFVKAYMTDLDNQRLHLKLRDENEEIEHLWEELVTMKIENSKHHIP